MSWSKWERVQGEGLDFAEIIYEKHVHEETGGGVARVSINRPEKYNAVTNATVDEMFRAFYDANHDPAVGVIVLAGVGKHFEFSSSSNPGGCPVCGMGVSGSGTCRCGAQITVR